MTRKDTNVCWMLALCAAVAMLAPASANLNLYLTQYEVRRLLGLSAELFYVREGVINEYALNFVVPVPAHIDSLAFTWQSLGRPLPYSVSLDVNNREALPSPRLNMSVSGHVPTAPETWSVLLPCSGDVAAEVDVVLRVNVTLAKDNIKALTFRRRKICLKADRTVTRPGAAPGAAGGGSAAGGSLGAAAGTDPEQTAVPLPTASVFYIAVGCACLLIALLVTGLTIYYTRSRKLRRQGDMLQESRLGSSSSSAQGHATFLAEPGLLAAPVNNWTAASSCKSGSYASFRRLPDRLDRLPAYTSCSSAYTPLDEHAPHSRSPDHHEDLQQRIAQLTIQRCRVRLRSVVLEGTFGRVYRGSYADEEGVEQEVLVKTVTDHASQVQVSLLLQEGMAMYGVSHKNVMSILGVSIEDHTAPFLLYPLRNHQNLKRFLQKCKLCPKGIAHSLTTQEVVDMALQITTGMQYLHRKRLLHRDLSARNCVVDDKLRVQITDNALARDLFPADYQCLGDNENRPVKWLAIESLSHKTFTTASDVWSFGVLLWELTTLAQQPYVEIDPFEMEVYLRDGYRLAQPVNCPDELFAVMAYCWAMSSEERPTFHQLNACLQEFYTQLTRYV
ncbi:tyrosine-protein kinase Dnt-like [Frankliniella occidentalis]|uniref:receptor protein-tyrosine kinase n=1 Tax=Frankliniella occidentalis TaxID=133901 RepID=A0A9C6WX52_FRAOC|nr:tyrosine-protein kinase Dnt-like [Frankliniella occidentalis]